jgi:hypothetical protein
MTIDPREAATSLQDIASIEQRTRTAVFYAGSSVIFILWGVLVAAGHALSAFYPRSAGTIWLVISVAGCAGTVAIVAARLRARPREARDWRLCWAIVALAMFGAAWSHLLGPVTPRPMIYAFQPSLFLFGFILAGIWMGRFFIILGLVGIALLIVGTLMPEPWWRPWAAVSQSGILIVAGIWLHRVGVPR